MGNCLTSSTRSSYERYLSQKVDEGLAEAKARDKKLIKVLLLGSGESGKSTIFKQFRILHQNGFSDEERQFHARLVRQNTAECIQALCDACIDMQIPLEDDYADECADRIADLNLSEDIALAFKDDFRDLWEDKGIQQAFQRSSEFHLLDNCQYFMSALDRVFAPDYTPSDQDILRSRFATTGIVRTKFDIDEASFHVFDVGGQRGERKKWIHCFDAVTAVLFIASLSEYDQNLLEARTRNRTKESLFLFEGIINLPWFVNTPVILFLNKNDIFKKKVARVDIAKTFPKYTGGLDYDAGVQFIQEQYFGRNSTQKTIYCHITDATNTSNVDFVWKSTRHIILEQNLAETGLMM